GFWIKHAEFGDLMHRGYRLACSHGHDWAEIARGLAIDEITPPISAFSLDQRQIAMYGRFQHVALAIDETCFLSLGEFRSVTGRSEEPTDARACCSEALGQVALWYEFELQFSAAIEAIEHVA